MYVPITLKQVALKNSTPPEVKELYNFALKNNFDEFTTLPMIRKKLKENFTVKVVDFEQYSKILTSFSFFDKANYVVENGITDIDDVCNLLFQIKEEVLYYFNPKIPKTFTGYVLKRCSNVPLAAFEKVGHNKLNIKPTHYV